ncbi:hypothetical protein, partial [Methylophaga sp. UBA1918]|uniref:hypothetical protein n=1 Tax=Methylophaga sp. UBA1918 TaxID=1946869 RepID=UPI00259C70C9
SLILAEIYEPDSEPNGILFLIFISIVINKSNNDDRLLNRAQLLKKDFLLIANNSKNLNIHSMSYF